MTLNIKSIVDNIHNDINNNQLCPYISHNLPDNIGNTGIIICSGGQVMLYNTYLNIKYIREKLGSKLPIIIYHCDNEISQKTKYKFKTIL